MKPLSILFLCVIGVMFCSCSMNIQKRLYRDGYYISFNHPNSPKTEIDADTSRSLAVQTTDLSFDQPICKTENPDTVSGFADGEVNTSYSSDPRSADQVREKESLTSTFSDQHESLKDVTGNEPDPNEESVRKLNLAALIVLLASLIFPALFLTFTAAFILSLMAFNKSKLLAPTEKNKELQRDSKTLLIISGILLGLMILALVAAVIFILIFSTGF